MRKGRSGGKSIFNDLLVNTGYDEIISAAEALKILKEASQPLRDAGLIDRNCLLSFAVAGRANVLTEWQLREGIRNIGQESEVLARLRIVPEMIRPTVLLHAQLRNPTNLGVANMLAQHENETTTMGYVAKLPFRIILENRIRKFAETVQVVIANGIEGGSTKLGIRGGEWNSLLDNAQRTGLGMLCSNSLAGAQPDYKVGEKCKAVDRCLDCNKVIVVADPDSIADIMIWHEALEKAESQWLEDRYERWEQIWIPWQAFFHIVLNEKMMKGELAVIKKKAVSIVEQRKASPGFNLPEPW